MKLHQRIKPGASVCVVGMGYVGLPLAIAFAKAGFRVMGCETNDERRMQLADNRSPFRHIAADDVAAANLSLTANPPPDCLAYVICVPTPLRRGVPDTEFIASAATMVAHAIDDSDEKQALVVLESTTYPGCTREMVASIMPNDTLVAYSPEREDPGSHTSTNIPKLVGGINEAAMLAAHALYVRVVPEVVLCESCEVAEMAKLWENSFRQVNIAAVNELKSVCHRAGIDPYRVIMAAKTKPFGFMPFYPSAGVGGHCIPVDPEYLRHWARERFMLPMPILKQAHLTNHKQAEVVAQATARAMIYHGMEPIGSRVLVWGVAYKSGIEDTRESPARDVAIQLQTHGCKVDWFDPMVTEWAECPDKVGRADFEIAYEAVVIVTPHKDDQRLQLDDYLRMGNPARLVVDTCDAMLGAPQINTRHGHTPVVAA